MLGEKQGRRVLKPKRGFSLIELTIVLAILAVLFGLAVAPFQVMIASSKTKSTAESFLSGLRNARSEAISRNAPMRFQLVSSLDDSCALTFRGPHWVVSQSNQNLGSASDGSGTTYGYGIVTGLCGSAAVVPPDTCTDIICANQPYIAYKSPGNLTQNIVVAGTSSVGAAASVVTFGPLGQVLQNMDVATSTTLTQIDVSSPSVPDAKAWRIQINASSGSMKICDPAASAVGTPLACT